ncbi:heavy metal translocating P-type ATPase [Eubacterium sp.]
MKKYSVYGMSCAACSSRVEKAVSKVDGVDSVAVNLLTNSMIVEGDVEPKVIMKAVEDAGYKAKPQENEKTKSEDDQIEELDNSDETKKIRNRFIWSLIFLVPLMYVSMGVTMWGFPAPDAFEKNHIAMGLTEMLFTIIIMIINKKFFVSGLKGLINKAPNMDTLVALGSGTSFGYSLYVLYAMTFAQVDGNMELVHHYMHEFYFESAAMILTLITLGKMLESFSKGKTTDALKGLMKLAPKTATIIDANGTEKVVDISKVTIGDIFVVRPGESIPTDSVIIEGSSAIDESALTGESVPKDVTVNDEIFGSTINKSGFIKCKATRVGEDTTLSQIIHMVSDAAATKAPIAKAADKVSGVFVPVVIVIALITIVVWLVAGKEVGFALARGISVLVISCPCALGLATPVAIMVGNGKAARNNILFKNAVALENTGKTRIVALDKTGTITSGKPVVTDIVGKDKDELLEIAYALESKSEHPLASAIVEYGKNNNIKKQEINEFSIDAGYGLKGEYEENNIAGGNFAYINKFANINDELKKKADEFAKEGKTPLYFCKDKEVLGIIAVADVIKEESIVAVKNLKNMGIKVVMITGDNEQTAQAIGKKAGVDEIYAGVLPQGKEEIIRKLSESGKTVMVGDGINDAPALTRADIGIAIGAGTDVAIDAASVVLMKSDLRDVPGAIRLSKGVLRNIHENLFWAFFYNVIGIPLAAGVWFPLFGLKLNPMFGAAAMSLSSVCVVTNALRLNLFKVHKNDGSSDGDNTVSVNETKVFSNEKSDLDCNVKNNDINLNVKETRKMEKIMTIEGMMCGHCEKAVKTALEAIDGVESATADHEKNEAVVKLSKNVDDSVLKETVEKLEYKVTEIK